MIFFLILGNKVKHKVPKLMYVKRNPNGSMTSMTSGMSGDLDKSSNENTSQAIGNVAAPARSGTESLRQHLQGKFQAKSGNASTTSSASSSLQGAHNPGKSENPPPSVKSSPNKRNRWEKGSKSFTSVSLSSDSRPVKEKVTSGKDVEEKTATEKPGKSVSQSTSSTKPLSPNRHQNANNTALSLCSNGQPNFIPLSDTNDLPTTEIAGSSSGTNYSLTSGKGNSAGGVSIGSGGRNNNKSLPGCSSTSAFVKSHPGHGQLTEQPEKGCFPNNGPAASSSSSAPSGDETFEDISIPVTGKKEPVKGRAWRDQQGVYTRYKCFGDGLLYKPGGNFALFYIGFLDISNPPQHYIMH